MGNPQLDDEAIFQIACKINDPKARSQYLDQVRGADPNLRHRIEAMLAGYEKEQKPLPEPGPTIDEQIPNRPGSQIGPYKLLEKIAEGGMGTVFMAEQSEPVARRVALKIVKPDRETPGTLARFDAERHALAMMDHPNIARVLDAGTTESGRPYFVMELVKGIPINKYCDEHRLTVNERLELFVDVCHAVQHAHQKGVIHRDLKPSNILVAEYDDKPVPKVIDFGVAKALGSKLTDLTMFTGFGEIIGTLEYMSPEQAKFNQQDVDTRSDIYALGVVLYELVTSLTPFDQQRLRAASIDEAVRIIRDEEPIRPSLRLSSNATLANIAAQRRIEPKRLGSLVRGELDWIVMKALDKERTRRYDTAAAFGEDVERFLHNEQITARPPTLAYTLRKLARRHRVALGILSSIMLILVLSTCVATWLAMRATEAEGRAGASLQAEKQQRGIAEARSADLRGKTNELRRQNYAFVMESAFRAWQVGSLAQLKEMLNSLVPTTADEEDLRGFEWRFLDARCKENLLSRLLETGSPIRSVAYSSDGRHLAIAVANGDLLLHDINTRRTITLNEGNGPKTDVWGCYVVFSPSGDFLVAPGTSHLEVYVWRATPDKAVAFTRDEDISVRHTKAVRSVAVSPDGRLVASAGGDNTTLVWDPRTGEIKQTLVGDCVAFALEGQLLLTSSGPQRSLTLWNAATGERLDTHRVGEQPMIIGRCGSLTIISDCAGMQFWSLENNTLTKRSSESSWRRTAQFSMSPDGREYAIAGFDDSSVRVCDAHTREQLMRFLHKGRVYTASFAPNGKSLAAGGDEGKVMVWDLQPRRRRIFRGPVHYAAAAAISHDSRKLAIPGIDGCVEIWDIETGTVQKTSGGSVILSIAFSPDGKTVASASEDGTVCLWDASSGDCIGTVPGHTAGVSCVTFSTDGKWLASGSAEELLTWDLRSKSLGSCLNDAGVGYESACFSPDGKYLAVGTELGNRTLVWDVHAGKLVKEIPFGSLILCVAFSPDGESVAMAGYADTAEVWDVRGWVRRYVLHGNGTWLTSIAYSPDGKSLVAASPAGEIRFWRAATGEPTGSLTVDRGIRRAFFAPNGNGIVWASMDGTVEYWSATPVEEIPGFGLPPEE